MKILHRMLCQLVPVICISVSNSISLTFFILDAILSNEIAYRAYVSHHDTSRPAPHDLLLLRETCGVKSSAPAGSGSRPVTLD